MKYEDYFNPKYKPKKSDIICTFRLNPCNKKSAGAVAAESSTGTWTTLTTSTEKRMLDLGAKVISIKGNLIKIAYSIELFEKGNMPQIFSSIAGNVFNMKEVKTLRLEWIDWSDTMINSFYGPKFGVHGIRKMLRVPKRPLCGTIIKPKLGLNASEHAQVAYRAWVGGVDIVKDDENLTHQPFNHFDKRIRETLKQRDYAEKVTGEKKIYMANVTAEANEMIKRAKFVKSCGGEYVMVDILTVGWSGLQTLRKANLGLVIHAHRAMHGALTRNKQHGIAMPPIADAARLIGVDQIHIGTAVGKMDETPEEVITLKNRVEGKLGKAKPVFAVCSGGLHPGHVSKLVKMLGNDIIIQCGGGVHGHPRGTKAGATALRQAIDATMKDISLKDYAKNHLELKLALNKWGTI
ncbi:MAG: type III ribulose-bisphosphate carboxylase [Nanoarchaeota archaeon]|nr:type III ribulose-bisphosphate carboxylase [Nanoarchaeota archaeon]MBU4124558.1 type III ribulose-bisphosphate carboxylase [Nanoarchaeota archaeon]